jgi:hypothetical protein
MTNKSGARAWEISRTVEGRAAQLGWGKDEKGQRG